MRLNIVIAVLLMWMTSSAWGQSVEVERNLSRAETAFAEGDHAEAGRLYDRAIAAEPGAVDVGHYARRADVFLFLKQYDAGLRWIDDVAIRAKGQHPELLGKKALLLGRSGRMAEGVALAESIIDRVPVPYVLHAFLAEHYVTLGPPGAAKAAKHLTGYLETRDPKLAARDADFWKKLGFSYLYLDRWADAQSALGRAADLGADGAETRAGLCAAATGRRQWKLAASACARATRDEGEPTAWHNLARAELARGRGTEARRAAQAYRERRPRDARGLVLLADIDAAAGRWGPALESLDAALALSPDDPWIAYRIGRASLAQEPPRAEVAIPHLERAARALPRRHGVTAALARAYGLAGRHEEAERALSTVVAARPDDVESRVLLGEVRIRQGRFAEAMPPLEEALARDKKHRRARTVLAWALEAQAAAAMSAGKGAEAQALLERAVELDPASARAWSNLGVLHLAAGRHAEAVAALERAVSQDPSAAHLALLGQAQARAGQLEAARKTLERVARMPDVAPPLRVTATLDLATTLLALRQPGAAFDVLDGLIGAVADDRILPAYAGAAIATSEQMLREGKPRQAHSILNRASSRLPAPDAAFDCQRALAALAARDAQAASAAIGRLVKSGARCTVRDADALPILRAWNEGLTARDRQAAMRLRDLARKAPAPLKPLAIEGLKQVVATAAMRAYEAGSLATARGVLALVDDRSDPHLRLLEIILVEGNPTPAQLSALEKLAPALPEAWVHLGILHDRRGEPREALAMYRRALAAGVSDPRVARWVAAKERFWGTEVAP